MTIQNLQGIPIPIIVDCLLDAFSNYYVQMPGDVIFWEKRYKAARIDWALSQGVFENGKLLAFITNGLDMHKGELTVFNSGTGVIESCRGQKWVDKMYDFGIQAMKGHGVEKCMLEVIQANARAIRVYKRVGFNVTRSLRCFKGALRLPIRQVVTNKADLSEILRLPQPNHHFYSWDNTNAAVQLLGDYQGYVVKTHDGAYIGYFTIKPDGYLAQFEAKDDDFEALFNGVLQISKEVRINNVDAERTDLIRDLGRFGLVNTVDQFEMEMRL